MPCPTAHSTPSSFDVCSCVMFTRGSMGKSRTKREMGIERRLLTAFSFRICSLANASSVYSPVCLSYVSSFCGMFLSPLSPRTRCRCIRLNREGTCIDRIFRRKGRPKKSEYNPAKAPNGGGGGGQAASSNGVVGAEGLGGSLALDGANTMGGAPSQAQVRHTINT